MAPSNVKEIESAIQRLSHQEIQELYVWLEENDPQPIDVRLKADLAAGGLDAAIDRALEDEKNGFAQGAVQLNAPGTSTSSTCR
jgi:rhodanese-related sulfurtransferase